MQNKHCNISKAIFPYAFNTNKNYNVIVDHKTGKTESGHSKGNKGIGIKKFMFGFNLKYFKVC